MVVEDNINPPLSNTTSVVIQVAPSAQPTNLLAVSGRGTYGGNDALTATLSSDGSPVIGETIAFDLNEQGVVSLIGTAKTDASGIATLSGVSIAGYGAGVYPGALEASFAGDATWMTSSGSGNLAVTPALATLALSGLSFTEDGNPHTATVSTDPEVLAGVTVVYTQYNIVVSAPIQVGSYSVTVTLNNPNYTAAGVAGTLVINPPAPRIVYEKAVTRRKLGPNGKPVGKPTLSGYAFEFSEPLDLADAVRSGNYLIDLETRRAKGKPKQFLQPIRTFSVTANVAGDWITLTFTRRETFPMGGQVTVVSGPAGGVTGTAGADIVGKRVFTISKGGLTLS